MECMEESLLQYEPKKVKNPKNAAVMELSICFNNDSFTVLFLSFEDKSKWQKDVNAATECVI